MSRMLDAESTRLLVDSRLQPPELVRLRLIKARANLDVLKEKGIKGDDLLEVEDRLLSVEFNIEQRREQQLLTPDDRKDSKSVQEDELDELNMLGSELRQRKPKFVQTDDKIALQQLQQHQLSTDLLEMTAAIKKNAQNFQQKLEADDDLMGQTSDAIQRTAGTMSRVGSQLSKYRKETIGWRFYLFSAAFILLIAFFGMFIIQIFGKW